MTTAPGRAAEYHADHENRLSSTLCRMFNSATPAHVKAYMDGRVRYESEAMTIGTCVHQMLLRDDRIVCGDFDSYRTKVAQEWRDSVRAAGRVPVLQKQYDECREIAQHVNGQIIEMGIEPTPFTKGKAEHVIRWTDNGADCRALLDWLRDDLTGIDDLKTTRDASPQKFRSHVFNMGYDIQAAFYVRAVRLGSKLPDDFPYPVFRWVVVETTPPYPVTIHTLSDADMYAAQVKVDLAIQLWNECQRSGKWPAYPVGPHEVTAPGWARPSEDALGEVDLEDVPF